MKSSDFSVNDWSEPQLLSLLRLNPPSFSPQENHRWLDPQRIPPGRQGFFKGGKGPRVDPSQKAPERMESSMTERPKWDQTDQTPIYRWVIDWL